MEATLATIVASASALVYAVVGEITEKAGVVNLSMEGTIMLSAMTGFAVAYTTGSVLLGFLAAAGGDAHRIVVAFASIERLNQIGRVRDDLPRIELSSFLGDPYVGQHGPRRAADPRAVGHPVPRQVLFRHTCPGTSYLAIVGGYLFVFHAPGLEMQGVGERADAAFVADRREPARYLYTMVGGALAG